MWSPDLLYLGSTVPILLATAPHHLFIENLSGLYFLYLSSFRKRKKIITVLVCNIWWEPYYPSGHFPRYLCVSFTWCNLLCPESWFLVELVLASFSRACQKVSCRAMPPRPRCVGLRVICRGDKACVVKGGEERRD